MTRSALPPDAIMRRIALRTRHMCSTSPVKRVGLVGLGAMGAPMCDNLMDAGFVMKVFDTNAAAVAAAPGAAAGTPGAAAAPGRARRQGLGAIGLRWS